MGLGPYDLPAGFTALSPDRQMFILVDLDRLAYSLPPISGLNQALTTAAEEGVTAGADPAPLTQPPWRGEFGSDWAGFGNALWGYYVWMYSDESAGWGHRDAVLYEAFGSGDLAVGAAAGVTSSGRASSTLLVQESSEPPTSYYSWAEAAAAGAGSYPYNPGTPQVVIGVYFGGSGAGEITGSFSCAHECPQTVPIGTRVSLTATPAAGSVFAGWNGPCSGTGACELTVNGPATITASFTTQATPAARSLPVSAPTVRLTSSRISAKAHSARFSFRSSTRGARFQCALSHRPKKRRKRVEPHFGSCSSPKTYKKLAAGYYTFVVRSTTISGGSSGPAERSFRIL